MTQKFANAARAELASTINAADTTISITEGGSLFPVANTGAVAINSGADWFKAVLQDATGFEVVYVRSHVAAANSFTNVLRGQEGTTAREFAAGSVIGLRQTASNADDWEAKAGTGANVFSGKQSGADNQLEAWMLKDVGHTFLDKGNSGTGPVAFSFADGAHQRCTGTGNFTWSLTNFPPTGNAGYMMIEAVNWGGRTITFPTVNWILPNGTTSTSFSTYLTAVAAAGGRSALNAAGTDFFIVWTRDAGATFYGKLV